MDSACHGRGIGVWGRGAAGMYLHTAALRRVPGRGGPAGASAEAEAPGGAGRTGALAGAGGVPLISGRLLLPHHLFHLLAPHGAPPAAAQQHAP